MQEALALWEERERRRAEFLFTLDEEAMQQLAHNVKRTRRLFAELTNPR
ncbi:MAG: hypothetical protein JO307_19315 [Bryobacterales bacterium]|nr:hypothetical protein [Bryobacterales bacterium]MBV9400813.1 hypothetical protein [Bryobacterales bacterium]